MIDNQAASEASRLHPEPLPAASLVPPPGLDPAGSGAPKLYGRPKPPAPHYPRPPRPASRGCRGCTLALLHQQCADHRPWLVANLHHLLHSVITRPPPVTTAFVSYYSHLHRSNILPAISTIAIAGNMSNEVAALEVEVKEYKLQVSSL